jgi:hypothetical protein
MSTTDVVSVLSRLKTLFAVKTDADLAEAMEVPKTTLSSWKKRESVPYSECVQIAQQRRVSLDWLLAGRDQPVPIQFRFSSDSPAKSDGDFAEKSDESSEKSDKYVQSEQRTCQFRLSEHESEQPCAGSIDPERLREAVEAVEMMGKDAPADRKARAVVLVYERLISDQGQAITIETMRSMKALLEEKGGEIADS